MVAQPLVVELELTELYALKGWILWYVNCISVKKGGTGMHVKHLEQPGTSTCSVNRPFAIIVIVKNHLWVGLSSLSSPSTALPPHSHPVPNFRSLIPSPLGSGLGDENIRWQEQRCPLNFGGSVWLSCSDHRSRRKSRGHGPHSISSFLRGNSYLCVYISLF